MTLTVQSSNISLILEKKLRTSTDYVKPKNHIFYSISAEIFFGHFCECVHSFSHITLFLSIFMFTFRLGAANSSINPILYSYMSKKFRISFMVSECHSECINIYIAYLSKGHWRRKKAYLAPAMH